MLLQGYIGNAIVFLDGCLHRSEFKTQVLECRKLQDKYPEALFIVNNGSYGIERLMIQGLQYASLNFDNIIVLEDDCFPTFDAIDLFLEALLSLPEDCFLFTDILLELMVNAMGSLDFKDGAGQQRAGWFRFYRSSHFIPIRRASISRFCQ